MGHQLVQKSIARARRARHTPADNSDEMPRMAAHAPTALSPARMMHLQRTIGNQAVQRLIQRDTRNGPGSIKHDIRQHAPVVAFAAIFGEKQGEFITQGKIAGYEGMIEILSLDVEPKGRSTRVRFRKDLDETSPFFHRARVSGEKLTPVRFDAIRRTQDGKYETFHSFNFSGGEITSIEYNDELQDITVTFPNSDRPAKKS